MFRQADFRLLAAVLGACLLPCAPTGAAFVNLATTDNICRVCGKWHFGGGAFPSLSRAPYWYAFAVNHDFVLVLSKDLSPMPRLLL